MATPSIAERPFTSLHSLSQSLADLAPKLSLAEAVPVLSIAAGAFTIAGLIAGEQTVEEQTLDAVKALTRSVEALGTQLRGDLESATNRILDALQTQESATYREALETAQARYARALQITAGLADGSLADAAAARSEFQALRYADTPTGLTLERDRLEQAIPALCRFMARHLDDLYARHGGDPVELALEGARLTDLVTSAIAFYTLLFTPDTLGGTAPADQIGADPVLRTNLALFEAPLTAATGALDRLMTRVVLEADANIGKTLTTRLHGRKTSASTDEEAAGLLSMDPPATDGFAGLAHSWPWLDFVVLLYPPDCASTYRAPVGKAGAADPAPGCGTQWQHIVVRDGSGYDWFVSWSPKQPTTAPDRGGILADYRWPWSHAGGTTAGQPPLAALDHAWRVLTGVEGWRSPARPWAPAPRIGFAAGPGPAPQAAGAGVAACRSRAEFDAILLDYARTLNPYEIARRFPSTMARFEVPLAYLAYWDAQRARGGWGYPLSDAEKATVRRLDTDESYRRNRPEEYGFPVSTRTIAMAATDPARVHLWGPRAMRRARPQPQEGWTQIGVALLLA